MNRRAGESDVPPPPPLSYIFLIRFCCFFSLDSVNAYRVMKCLHTLAHERGKTIMFAIHAPDSALFELFTNVILMAKGYLMYSGSRQRLLPAMESLAGRPCPAQYNPTDFAIHTIAAIPENELAAKVKRSGKS